MMIKLMIVICLGLVFQTQEVQCQHLSLDVLEDSLPKIRASLDLLDKHIESSSKRFCFEPKLDSSSRRSLFMILTSNQNNTIIRQETRFRFFYNNYSCFTQSEKRRIQVYLNGNICYRDAYFFSLVSMYHLDFDRFLKSQVDEGMFRRARKKFIADSFSPEDKLGFICAATLANTHKSYYRYNDSIISMVLDMYYDSGVYENVFDSSFGAIPMDILRFLNTRSSIIRMLPILDSCEINFDRFFYMYYSMIIQPKLAVDRKILHAMTRKGVGKEELLQLVKQVIHTGDGIKWKSYIID